MKIFYDLQVFMWTKYSGILRYFSGLISAFKTDTETDVVLQQVYCINRNYKDLYPSSHWLIS